MGFQLSCCQSRQKVIVTTPSSFIPLQIPEIDKHFEEAKAVLTEMEKAVDNFKEVEYDLMNVSNCKKLKDPSILEAVKVLFWAISAAYGAEIVKSNIVINPDLSKFSVKTNKLHPETEQLYCYFIKYLILISETKTVYTTFVPRYNHIISNVDKIIPNVEAIIQQSEDTNYYDSKDVYELFDGNVKKLKRLKKSTVESQSNFITEKMSEYEHMRPQIVKIYAEADVMGAKICKSGLMTPAEIFDKFHTGQRQQLSVFSKELIQY